MSARNQQGSQRGSALLSVLLIVGVVGAMAALALDRLRLATHIAANALALDQARTYALAAETIGALRIEAHNGRATSKTTLAGHWNTQAFGWPLPGGTARVRAQDGGNCFNLNSVVAGDPVSGYAPRASGMAQFEALLHIIEVPPPQARRIAAALADWIDSDDSPLPGGAEDPAYLRLPRPYRTGKTLLADRSELRAIAGMTPALYPRLRPWLCALPSTALSPINVNTLLPDQAPLLAMLLPGRIDLADARALILARPRDGWNSIAEFWHQPALAGHIPTMDVQQQPAVSTRWFRLDIDITLADATLSETALIDGGASPARLIARSWGDER